MQGQLVNGKIESAGELEYPLEDPDVKTYALPTKFVPIAGHLPGMFLATLLTAVLGTHP